MKRLYLVLLLSTLYLGIQVLAQSVDENYIDKNWDDKGCSHKGAHFASSGNKSIINPNPHVFDYDVKFYKLDLEATNVNNQIFGSATISAVVVIPQMEIFSIEFSNKLVADSAFINGVKYLHTHTAHNISVSLPIAIQQGTLFHFQLYYHTPVNYTSSYYSSTLHPTYGNFPVSQTLSEPYFAHEFMPCKQELEDKADSVHVFITTNPGLKVAGPGLLTEVNLPDGKIRHEWRTYQKTAYYLIFFAVSDYQEYNIYAKPGGLPNDSILIQNYVFDYPNCLESNKAAMDNTSNMVNLLSNLYSLYPFHTEKYGHYLWYPTSFSGMEHITMSGMRYLNTYLISHELGHSWFGDNVTCASWSDIWINEGFATYTEYLVNQYLVSQAVADANMLLYMNNVMTLPGGSVYVPLNETNNVGRVFNSRLTYRKGSTLVHMIRFVMNNDAVFFQTLQNFQLQFAGNSATGLDFKAVCENTSGIDFTDFFNQWYFGEGYPTFSLVWSQNMDTVFLNSIQTTSTSITTLFKTPVEFKLLFAGGSQIFRFEQLTNDTIFKVVIPHEITDVTIDPNNWLLNQSGTITHRKNLNLIAYIEGPFNEISGQMATGLNPIHLPLYQPYDQSPWNYNGTEEVAELPNSTIVDWLLIELRDAPSASQALSGTRIARQSEFLLHNGSIVASDGNSFLQFDNPIINQLFVVIHHRNHLSVMSAAPLSYQKGIYSYDFSTGADQIYQGSLGCKELKTGVWGLIAGDADANGIIEQVDKVSAWEISAGMQGYLPSDLNLDGHSNNQDKDDFWLPNVGKGSYLPQ